MVGESLNDGEEDEPELSSEATRFQIVGTVANKDANKLSFASDEYWVSLSFIIYFVLLVWCVFLISELKLILIFLEA